MAGFLHELRRRNILRAAALYATSAWALAQGITSLGPSVGAPDWLTRWFLVAAAIGFPFWLAFAWYYELTPQGIRRESELFQELENSIEELVAVAVKPESDPTDATPRGHFQQVISDCVRSQK